ncbi:type II toxin-antitoxin system RelE/ParE family toxin [Patescibacteria group bacterium]|nr:MAG: type II toxin-antitoxin system RelE/ParE family toxin [Patescibacteria group bacterium]
MAFKLVLTTQAEKDLRSLDHAVARRIVHKLVWLGKQSNPSAFAKRLREPAAGDVRFRVGDYRLIGIVNASAKRIEIVKIGHRREIYL